MVKAMGWLTPVLLCVFFVSIGNTANAELYVVGQLGLQISNNFGEVGPDKVGVRCSDLDQALYRIWSQGRVLFPAAAQSRHRNQRVSCQARFKAQPSVVTGPVPDVFGI